MAISLNTYSFIGKTNDGYGFVDINKHYLCAAKNFLFFTSENRVLKTWKLSARKKHGKMREIWGHHGSKPF